MLCLQAIERYETFFSVRGSVRTHNTAKPITPHTRVQVAWLVMAFIAMVNVRT